ncbi:hypothetical protein [Paraclostridium dentum]|uniref:hypothetical protein n=1 Tax=Paraclostridium dentum TaxID=2662455 RepID=UPI003F3B725B
MKSVGELESGTDSLEVISNKGNPNLAKNTSNSLTTVKMTVWNKIVDAGTLESLGLKIGDSITLKLYMDFKDAPAGTEGGYARITFYDKDNVNIKTISNANEKILANQEGYSHITGVIPDNTYKVYIGVQRNGATGDGVLEYNFK